MKLILNITGTNGLAWCQDRVQECACVNTVMNHMFYTAFDPSFTLSEHCNTRRQRHKLAPMSPMLSYRLCICRPREIGTRQKLFTGYTVRSNVGRQSVLP